jgi:hypothetical protein
MEMIHLEFLDGKIWQINITEQLSDSDPEVIADRMLETMQEYKDDIKNIDFKINIERLKKDIKNETNKLF